MSSPWNASQLSPTCPSGSYCSCQHTVHQSIVVNIRPPVLHDPATAPWVIIPPEIWSQIFEYAVGGPPLYFEQLHPSTIICLVCHSWNIIALDTPRMWASISLHRDSALCTTINGELGSRDSMISPFMPEIWIRRAKTIPVQISMFMHRTCGRTVLNERSLVPAMQFISTCMQQISRLSITCASGVQVASVILHLTSPAPYLETFALLHPRGSINQSPVADADNTFFHPTDGATPKLRHAKLVTLRANWPNSMFPNLVSLEFDKIGFFALTELSAVLAASPFLLHLSLTDFIFTAMEIASQATQPTIRHERLISLCLAPIFHTGLMLLEKLNLPNLAELDIQDCRRKGPSHTGPTGENRLSFQSLETLRLSSPLYRPSQSYEAIAAIFCRCSNITTLLIGDTHFLEFLICRDEVTKQWMCPRLTHLHFAENTRFYTAGWDRLSRAITHRRSEPSIPSIISIDIPLLDDTDDTFLEDIQMVAPEISWRGGGRPIVFKGGAQI